MDSFKDSPDSNKLGKNLYRASGHSGEKKIAITELRAYAFTWHISTFSPGCRKFPFLSVLCKRMTIKEKVHHEN